MNTINKWDYAPDGATHHAVDTDGRGFWYAEEPYFDGEAWWPHQTMTLGDDREYWKAAAAHSLEARPVQGAVTMREACESALAYFIEQWKNVGSHPTSQYADYVEDLCSALGIDKSQLAPTHPAPLEPVAVTDKVDRNTPEE